MTIAETIRNRRLTLGLSRGYIARGADLPREYIQRLEDDICDPTVEEALEIGKVLSIRLPLEGLEHGTGHFIRTERVVRRRPRREQLADPYRGPRFSSFADILSLADEVHRGKVAERGMK